MIVVFEIHNITLHFVVNIVIQFSLLSLKCVIISSIFCFMEVNIFMYNLLGVNFYNSKISSVCNTVAMY
jgi:hypothetical protein